jgi:hypothetical protein
MSRRSAQFAIVGALAGTSATAVTHDEIAGYKPLTDVVAHNALDLDQADLETFLKAKDYTAATNIYANGKNSAKSSGFRTIKGLSKDLTGEEEWDKMFAYYGDANYADKWVSAALANEAVTFTKNGNADFKGVDELGSDNDETRIQAIKKGTVYLNIWMYALHEFEAAVKKCEDGVPYSSTNTAAAHVWDEGVAFYTGSLQGTDGKGSGKLMYGLAQKRCSDFKTCDDDTGVAKSNNAVFRDAKMGIDKINAGNCAGLKPIVQRIAAFGFVPIIQGALKYGSKVGDWSKTESGSGDSADLAKAMAEGSTFAAAVLGRLNACSAADAKIVYDNLKINAPTTDKAAVVKAFENNYRCMGIMCSDIGAYGEATPCTDTWPNIAGYVPGTDVMAHNAIDLDQNILETLLKAETISYAGVGAIYSTGGNSVKSSSARTIKGFSKSLAGEPEYDKFKAYYGDDNYADKWVSAAIAGTATGFSGGGNADFSAAATKVDATRIQAIKKGTVYLNIWMYAIHELESAIKNCKAGGDAAANNKAIHVWDEGVAFYTGTLAGEKASTTKGKLMYGLAQSRCSNFKTCGAKGDSTDGVAKANIDAFALFAAGKADLEKGVCTGLRQTVDSIIADGFIPIIQGVLKYTWEVDSTNGPKKGDAKYIAEAATFAAGLLGRLNACSPAAAKVVYDNSGYGAATTDFAAVKAALEANYQCMGVTCAEIGGYMKDGAYAAGFSAGCSAAPAAPAADAITVTTSFTLSGDVADYDASKQYAIKATIGAGAGVPASNVALTIVTASVKVTAVITVSDAAAAATALNGGVLKDAASLEAALKANGVAVTVESAPTAAGGGGSTTIIIIVAAVVVVLLIIIVAVLMKSRKPAAGAAKSANV